MKVEAGEIEEEECGRFEVEMEAEGMKNKSISVTLIRIDGSQRR